MSFEEARQAFAKACLLVEKIEAELAELKRSGSSPIDIAQKEADLSKARLDRDLKEENSKREFNKQNNIH